MDLHFLTPSARSSASARALYQAWLHPSDLFPKRLLEESYSPQKPVSPPLPQRRNRYADSTRSQASANAAPARRIALHQLQDLPRTPWQKPKRHFQDKLSTHAAHAQSAEYQHSIRDLDRGR